MEKRQLCIGRLTYMSRTSQKWELFSGNDEPTSIILKSANTLSVMSEKDECVYGTITFSGFLDCKQTSHDYFQLQTSSGIYALQVISEKDISFVKTFFANLTSQLQQRGAQEALKPNSSFVAMKSDIDDHIYTSLKFQNKNKKELEISNISLSEEQVLTNELGVIENHVLNFTRDNQTTNQDPQQIVNQNYEKKETDKICDKIKNAVELKNVEEAKLLAEIAAKKGLKLSIHVLNENYPCNDFSIHVQVVDKESSNLVRLIIPINPFVTTVSMLKFMIAEEYKFPYSCQRWIINNKVVKDHELLSKSGVQHSGTVIFLYLISKFEIKIHKSVQTGEHDKFSDKLIFEQVQTDRDRNEGTKNTSDLGVWECSYCTYINLNAADIRCVVCLTSRQSEFFLPPGFKINLPPERL